MKMKIVKTLIGSIAALGAMVSCDLSEYPYGFYSDKNFYNTPEDAESAIMYAYNALTNLEYSRGIFYIGEAASETVSLKSGEDANNPGAQALDEWNITDNANNQTLQVYFKYCYVAINRANAIIKNVEGSDLDEALKTRLLGEAYFLRAYSHFSLVKVFGLVPLQREMVETVDNTTPSMAKTMDEAYDMMIGDLKIAEANLQYTNKVGRANKAAAQGMLAKLYLTAASSKESGVRYYTDMRMTAEEMYTEAATWAKKVLDASTSGEAPFGLAPTLAEIYDVDQPDGCEHLFIMSMDRTGQNEGNYSKIGMLFMPYNNGSNFYVKMGEDNLVASHYGYEVFPTNTEFYNSFDSEDKRKTELMSNQMYDANGGALGTSAYYFTSKYIDPHQVSESTGDKSSVKPYLLRFSEVALIYAEAMGSDDGGWVARIRARAGLEPLDAGLTKEQFRDAVVQERAWELAFEGNRLYDLRRKAMVTKVDPNAQAAGISEADAAFYPIPQREIDLNPGLYN